MKTWLIDTGPLVAYIDRSDPAHEAVASVLEPFAGQLVTTSAVVTEAMYFLGDSKGGAMALAELLLNAGARIEESTQPEQLLEAAQMMDKYGDTPMDFADATLVLTGEALGALEILTLDRRGFATYRTTKGKAFRQVLR